MAKQSKITKARASKPATSRRRSSKGKTTKTAATPKKTAAVKKTPPKKTPAPKKPTAVTKTSVVKNATTKKPNGIKKTSPTKKTSTKKAPAPKKPTSIKKTPIKKAPVTKNAPLDKRALYIASLPKLPKGYVYDPADLPGPYHYIDASNLDRRQRLKKDMDSNGRTSAYWSKVFSKSKGAAQGWKEFTKRYELSANGLPTDHDGEKNELEARWWYLKFMGLWQQDGRKVKAGENFGPYGTRKL
jgi:hypothetical protein